ncbi:unnamed protein product [Parnassius apollo]|uniref:(apollo) hypothetical protein n=1 Tax=Parnassius apollo TaxID=110799 RepID=A0A8S3X7R4_PARAO|nr:unnamed protein product [Parnassius apollo]
MEDKATLLQSTPGGLRAWRSAITPDLGSPLSPQSPSASEDAPPAKRRRSQKSLTFACISAVESERLHGRRPLSSVEIEELVNVNDSGSDDDEDEGYEKGD